MSARNPKFPNRLQFLRLRGQKVEDGMWLTYEEVAKIRGITAHRVRGHEKGTIRLDEHDILEYARLYKVESFEIFAPRPREMTRLVKRAQSINAISKGARPSPIQPKQEHIDALELLTPDE